MASKRTYTKTTVFITVTVEEIEKLLIEKYASLGLVSNPDVEFVYSVGTLESATIEYELQGLPNITEV